MFTSGVPDSVPLSNTRPAGRAGERPQNSGTPALVETVRVDTESFRVYVWSATLAITTSGSLMVMLKLWLTEPPELLANTVNGVVDMFTCGVPESTPLLKLKPVGNAGAMPHSFTTPPSSSSVSNSGRLKNCNSVMLTPRVKTRSVMFCRTGKGSVTVKLKLTLVEPPELLANTV